MNNLCKGLHDRRCTGVKRLWLPILAALAAAFPIYGMADTVTLAPNAAGDESALTLNGAATRWQAAQTDDGDTSYVSNSSGSFKNDLYNLDDTALTGTINSVRFYYRARASVTANQVSAAAYLKTHGATYGLTEVQPTTDYSNYSPDAAMTTNPNTSLAWTWTEVNALQAGVSLKKPYSTGSNETRVTRVWVVVDYTPPVLSPVAVDDNATVSEDASATTIDVRSNDTNAGSASISAVSQPTNGTVVITNAGADLTYEPDADYCNDGDPTDDFTYTLSPGDSTATVHVTVTCVNDPPVITSVSPASQTANYSDYIGTVTITATDIDTPTSVQDLTLSQSGAPSNLPNPSLASTASCSDSGAGQTCTWTMDGQVLVAGTNVFNIDFTANDGSADNDCTGDVTVCRHVLTVIPEDAGVLYDEDNDVAVQVETDGGTSGEFHLFFSAWETDDPDNPHGGTAQFGDLNNMTPNLVLTPVGPGGPVSGSCDFVAPLPVYPDEGYDQVALFDCVFDNVPVNVYEALATVDGGTTTSYYTGSGDGMVTVFDPSLGFTTGGGWFYWPDTAIPEDACLEYDTEEPYDCLVPDPCAGYAGDRTNFGWTMKYNKKRTNLQGSLLMMRHTIDALCEEAGSYKVKSNALNGLSIGSSNEGDGDFGWAAFSGKATYAEPGFDPVGNHQFTVYAEDHGEQGCDQDPADEFWIEVTDGGAQVLVIDDGNPDNGVGTPVDNSDPGTPADGDDVPISCGNIYVPHAQGNSNH